MRLSIGPTLTEGVGYLRNREIYRKISRTEFPKLPLNYLEAEIINGKLMFSFLDEKRIDVSKYDHYNSKLRQHAKPGKIFKKLFPDWSDDIIRTTVEALQGELTVGELQIFTVEGDDIRKYYQWPKIFCTKPMVSSAPLQGSCYQGQVLDVYFDSVLANPDKYRLVVAKVGDRMDGRAMLVHGHIGTTEAAPVGWFCDKISCNTPANISVMQSYITKEFNPKFNGSFLSPMKKGKALHHMSQLKPISGWEGLYAGYAAVKMQDAWTSDPIWYVQGKTRRGYHYALPPDGLELPKVYPFPTEETSRYTKLSNELRYF